MENDSDLKKQLEENKAVIESATSSNSSEWWSPANAMTMSATILVFGICVLAVATYLIRIGKRPDDVLRTVGTISVIVGSLFLVVAGYDDKQIAPVMGLLGTVVGYLLGKTSSNASRESGK